MPPALLQKRVHELITLQEAAGLTKQNGRVAVCMAGHRDHSHLRFRDAGGAFSEWYYVNSTAEDLLIALNRARCAVIPRRARSGCFYLRSLASDEKTSARRAGSALGQRCTSTPPGRRVSTTPLPPRWSNPARCSSGSAPFFAF